MSEEVESGRKVPGLFRNYISFAGAGIAIASFASVVLLFLIDETSKTNNPYIGILAYIIFPSVLIFGIFIIFLGMLVERRRRRNISPSEIRAYPIIDLNDPRRRRNFFAFLSAMFLFIFVSAFGSYRAYEFSESVEFCGTTCHTVMRPEFTAYKAGAHARVRCVDCHVGAGAGWYVRSKLSGAYQLYSVTFHKYSRPITTPVHNLRPAPETCEQCHWPEKFFGAQLKIFNHYGYDEYNSLRQTRMLINVGGGSPRTGQVQGIHWHMNIANEITYFATDDHRQNIPWVQIRDWQGRVTVYTATNAQLTPQQIAAAPKRKMDCVDCHNRPAHVYVPPNRAVDESFVAGKLDASLPFLKRQAVEVLSKPYATTDEALNSIASGLDGFYRTNYPDVYSSQSDAIKSSIAEVQRIYQTYFFPEMRTDWQTHPDNIGHYYFQGCFRCHDGQHVSSTGQMIRNDCNICHTVLDQTNEGTTTASQNGSFQHPVDLGDLASLKCTVCHKGAGTFQHPVNLGNISEFKCSECHSRPGANRRS